MPPLYMIGAGRFATELLEALGLANPQLVVAGFFDDNPELATANSVGLKFLGPTEAFLSETPADSRFVLAIGDSAARERLDQKFSAHSKNPFSVIHPTAVISPSAQIAEGAYIGAFAFIGPRAKLGRQTLVNVSASIGHDAVLEDYVQVCPGARVSGCAVIEHGAFMASNSVVPPSGRLGRYARLAANSFAARPVPENALAVGVPAKLI